MQHSQISDGRDRFDRLAFCKAAGVATAVGVVEASLGSVLAHADLTKEQRDRMTPDENHPADESWQRTLSGRANRRHRRSHARS